VKPAYLPVGVGAHTEMGTMDVAMLRPIALVIETSVAQPCRAIVMLPIYAHRPYDTMRSDATMELPVQQPLWWND
jgi:hypothetical protein